MLKVEEIRYFIEEDKASTKKRFAAVGQRYYEGEHDIKDYKLYFYNADGELVEDKTRSNIKISHPFFTELVDQATQYALSGTDGYIKSDLPELQSKLDEYFNNNEDFNAELYEAVSGVQSKGFDYMYARKKANGTTTFQCADAMGVVEVEGRFASDKQDHILYWYVERIDKDGKTVKRIQDWDRTQTYFYVQLDEGDIEADENEPINPRPHIVKIDEEGNRYNGGSYGTIPFFRMDNNKKQTSDLKNIKALIDDYDLMACGLSNNIQDAQEYLVVVKGLEGEEDMDRFIKNKQTKKVVGLPADGNEGIEYKTVDIPYEARKTKLELDEKNIYRFGMGLNTAGLKDTSATTNVAIKAAYSLLDLKVSKLTIKLKQFLRKLLDIVLAEINEVEGTDYQQKDVYFNFEHEIMSNAEENARIELTEAQTQQAQINTILSLAAQLGDELLIELICEALDLDYEQIKSKLPKDEELDLINAQNALNEVVGNEQGTEGNTPITTE